MKVLTVSSKCSIVQNQFKTLRYFTQEAVNLSAAEELKNLQGFSYSFLSEL